MITGAMHWAERSCGQFSRVRVAACREGATCTGCSTRQKYNGMRLRWSIFLCKSFTLAMKYLICANMALAGALADAELAGGNSPRLRQTAPDGDTVSESPQPALFRSRRFHERTADQQKYITYPTTGWTNGVVHWRYNDAGRIFSVASASAMISIIQAEQAKWSAVCNVQFIYDGTSTNLPSLVAPGGLFDGVNVIGWGVEPSPQTGETGIGWAVPEPGPIVEGDIELNNTFNPDVTKTVLHELGHMLGLQHSNVAGVVMSGPPQTPYVSLSTLQSDDIAGCQSFYGAPVPRTITGTITNGASPLAGVTFCARPATGVTCTASGGAGAYSCTVPNGWSGLLHAPGPTGLRIKPQSFTNVTASLSGQNPVVQSIGTCNLDVDNNGLIEPATDGVAILRRMLGISSSGFSGLSGSCAGNTTPAAIFGATTLAGYNVTGAASVRATTDGTVVLRAMRGLTGTAVTNSLGLAASGATRTDWTTNLRNYINTTCGSDFQ